MSAEPNPRAVIGGNSRDPLDDEIERICREFQDELDDRCAEAGRVKIEDEESAGRATALVKVFIDIEKAVENRRTELKAPYIAAGKRIDVSFGALTDVAQKAKRAVLGLVDTYRKAQERAAQEAREAAEAEARRKAAEAERAAQAGNVATAARLQAQADEAAQRAEAPVAAPTIRSAYGQTATSRTSWQFTITDAKKLPKTVTEHAKVRAAIEDVLRSMVRGGAREIPGVKIFPKSETVVR